MARGKKWNAEIGPAPIPVCGDLSPWYGDDSGAGGGSRAQAARLLERSAVISGQCEFPVN
jgi:hypothetical protein